MPELRQLSLNLDPDFTEIAFLDATTDHDIAELTVEIRLDDKGGAPTQVALFTPDANGKIRTTKGEFLFDAEALKTVLAKASDYGNDYCFDIGHSMVSPQPGAKPVDNEEAAGWYRLKADGPNLVTEGLSWTGDIPQRLSARKLRYISPTFRFDAKTKRVTEFINAALTNLPATKGMRPLVASRTEPVEPPPEPKPMKALLAALSLSANATEEEALAVLNKLSPFKTEVFSLTGKADLAEAVKELKRWKDAAAENIELTAKIQKMKQKKEAKKLAGLVKEAIDDGRLPPSMEEETLELGRKGGSDFLKKYLKSLAKLSKGKGDKAAADEELARKAKAAGEPTELSKEQLEVCTMLGLDPKIYAKTMVITGAVKVSDMETNAKPEDKGGATGTTPISAVAAAAAASGSTMKVKATTTKDA